MPQASDSHWPYRNQPLGDELVGALEVDLVEARALFRSSIAGVRCQTLGWMRDWSGASVRSQQREDSLGKAAESAEVQSVHVELDPD